nr:hypothetical protein [Bradyrhizobium manausense]
MPFTLNPSDRTNSPASLRHHLAGETGAASPRRLARFDDFVHHSHLRMRETQGHSDHFIVTDVVAMDLSTGAASHDVTIGIKTTQLAIARSAGQRLPTAEIKHELGRLAQGVRSAPAMSCIPVTILNLHPTLSAVLEPQIVSRRIAPPLIGHLLHDRWLPRHEGCCRFAIDSP